MRWYLVREREGRYGGREEFSYRVAFAKFRAAPAILQAIEPVKKSIRLWNRSAERCFIYENFLFRTENQVTLKTSRNHMPQKTDQI